MLGWTCSALAARDGSRHGPARPPASRGSPCPAARPTRGGRPAGRAERSRAGCRRPLDGDRRPEVLDGRRRLGARTRSASSASARERSSSLACAPGHRQLPSARGPRPPRRRPAPAARPTSPGLVLDVTHHGVRPAVELGEQWLVPCPPTAHRLPQVERRPFSGEADHAPGPGRSHSSAPETLPVSAARRRSAETRRARSDWARSRSRCRAPRRRSGPARARRLRRTSVHDHPDRAEPLAAGAHRDDEPRQ